LADKAACQQLEYMCSLGLDAVLLTVLQVRACPALLSCYSTHLHLHVRASALRCDCGVTAV
jgi:hypothetical protein